MYIDAHAHIFKKINGTTKNGPTKGIGYGRVKIGSETLNVLPPLNKATEHRAEMLIENMKIAKVEKAVLLQGPFYGECNGYVSKAVKKFPGKFAASAYMDPWDRNAKEQFNKIVKEKVFSAIKLECSENTGLFGLHKDISLVDESVQWLWEEMEQQNFVLVLDLGPIGSSSYQTMKVEEIARRHSNLKIVIAHLAQPEYGMQKNEEKYEKWLEQIDIGRMDNVWFDTAALPEHFSYEPYPYEQAMGFFKISIDRIGADKILWGTDTPGLLNRASYSQLISLSDIFTCPLNHLDKEKIKYGNAYNLYFNK